ncbi:MAG: glycoside hydrolase family 38 C-terminal domain-containing protein, partial [bacterium]
MPYYQENLKKRDLPRIKDRIQSAMYTPVAELNATAWITPEPVPYSKRRSGRKVDMKPGKKWGNLFDCAWFHFTGRVPSQAAGKKVVLLIDLNGEACVVDSKGNPIRGLTNVNSVFDRELGEPGKRVVQFLRRAKGGEKVDLWADAGCNDLFGTLQENGTLNEAVIAVCNQEMRALYYDFEVLHELMIQLPADRARHQRILFKLEEAAHCLREFTEEEAKAARAVLAPELAKKNGDPSLTISAIGSAHIDLGWLWPIRETFRKGARTFSTVLELLGRYPDSIFGASQPQLYQWMKDLYPHLYKRIKKRISEGRWEPLGAMWVEADANVSGGEALVRQILYGKRFFRDEFGWDVKIAWLPDVFGFSAALPQLFIKSGVEYFMTTKMSWSQFDKHPHHTFFWEGIDGSRVLTHMPPEDSYNSSAAPRAITKIERAFHDKGISDRCLMIFGIGDGGGGPGAEHLERLQREKNLDGLAPVVQETSDEFFQRIARDTSKYQTWTGELYLERHQGTYTTQARNKYYNRKLELALRELEFWSSISMLGTKKNYPSREVDRIWKEMLLYQFHDILPGSSITRVYDESLERYRDMLKEVDDLTAKSQNTVLGKIDTSGMKNPIVVTNSLSWKREEWLQFGRRWVKVSVPSMGYTTIDTSLAAEKPVKGNATPKLLENDLLRIRFAKDGTIESIFDKEHQREAIAGGESANNLNVYEDTGDAWDIPIYYDKKTPGYFQLDSVTARVDGPRAIVKQIRTFGESKLVQEIILTEGSRRIDFVTEVDWRESNKMLRASFPLSVRSTEATCDIQFGQIKRPTHSNTSWDMGKYEICAHKWIDISQRDYGVALLNDCKYGHRVHENILDINLLRSPTHPDPKADRVRHRFTYALFPHAGDPYSGGVVRAGYELNVPLKSVAVKSSKGALPVENSFIQVDAENIIVEAVKKAEDSNNVILRLYEAHGART